MEEKRLEDLKYIDLIPYCHTDYAWTNLRAWHVSRYLEAWRETLDLMEEHPEYTFLLDNVTHVLLPFLRYCPERLEEMRKFVRSGNVELCPGGWSLVRPNQVGEETFVRNLAAADRKFRELFGGDVRIETYFNADTDMGHGQLPQILRLMGYRYYQFQRPENHLNRIGVPKQFRWQGIDGSEVICARAFYGGFSEAPYAKPRNGMAWEERKAGYAAEELASRLRNQTTPWLQQFQGIDDMLPLTNRVDEPIDLFGFVRDWNAHETVPMGFSTLTDHFRRLEGEELRLYKGTVEPHEVTYNLHAQGDGSMWRLRFSLEEAIRRLETACAVLEQCGGVPYPAEELDGAWRSLFEITGHAIEAVMEPDWDRLYPAAMGLLLTLNERLNETMEAIADAVGCGGEDEHTVLNLTGQTVTIPVRLICAPARGVRELRLRDDTGREIPWQRVNVANGDKAYVPFQYSTQEVEALVTLPPFGTRVLREEWTGETIPWLSNEEKRLLLEDQGAGRTGTLDHEMRAGELRAVFRGGRLVSLGRKDTVSARPLLDLRFSRTKVRNDWLFEMEPESETNFVPERGEVILDGPIVSMFRVFGMLGSRRCEMTYTLGKVPGALTVDVKLEGREENGYATADFACDAGSPLAADIPFGWEARDPKGLWDVDTEGEYEITWKGQYFARTWSSFRTGGTPMAVVSKDCGVYWRVQPEDGLVRLVLARTPARPEEPYGRLDAWKYRAVRRSPEALLQHFSFALAPEGDPAALCRLRTLLRFRPAVGRSWKKVRAAAPSSPIAPLDGAEADFTALYRENGAWIARFYECAGTGGTLRASVPETVRQAEKIDFPGRVLESCPVSGGRVEIPLRPFEIVTLRFM